MNPADEEFILQCLRIYYYEYFGIIDIPPELNRHEFGYKRPNSGMMRHIQLQDAAQLRSTLMRELPLDVFLSPARYLSPTSPMPEKEWQSSDLIFDIDAKDLNLECRPSHTVQICTTCGMSSDKECPCDSPKKVSTSVACGRCINASKNEVRKLLDILSDDIGIEESQVRIYFSGNDGFHIHIRDSKLSNLNSLERSELVDYVMFRNILPERLGVRKDNTPSLPKPTDLGWPGRFARHMHGSKMTRPPKNKKVTSDDYAQFSDTLKTLSGILGACVDPGVTTDIRRIFRMPGTINGKSGMTKMLCTNIKKFNPYKDAVLIHDKKVTVRASCPIQFRLMNKKFGPYYDEDVSIPAYAALYLICKQLAHIS
ncbi:MAG: DNA primase [Cenarchaeum sp. SB0665_bin_23]|nr:DNA primase [Cenarchaeum sp. SB0664_bin_35]MXY61673.1 DNA primase [Cenarchaeum sp. SB0665_bin_23]MYB47201.1 DNA primase [Cenarchaeum sp. SB0662_bin_33]MYG32439.1 DNA primase [Cenarchaeum sp. SB0677_bin_16]